MNTSIKKLNKSIQAVLALGLLGAAGTASANCATSAIQCVAAAAGTDLACAASVVELGANPIADYGCGIAVLGTSGACADMSLSCKKTTRTGTVVPLAAVGIATGTRTAHYTCGNTSAAGSKYNVVNRMRGIRVQLKPFAGKGTLVSSLQINCAHGTHTFISNFSSGGWLSTNCPKSNLIAGARSKRNSHGIMDVAGVCDYATRPKSGTNESDLQIPTNPSNPDIFRVQCRHRLPVLV
jgi:hypothetical protein